MSDLPRVNELATVIREHCPAAGLLGRVVRVSAIEPGHPSMYLRCEACGGAYAHGDRHALIATNRYHPLGWLRRLPPPESVLEYDTNALFDSLERARGKATA